MRELLVLKIRMAHEITARGVSFYWGDHLSNNALDQLERELQRIVAEEVEHRLAVHQVNREEAMRCD